MTVGEQASSRPVMVRDSDHLPRPSPLATDGEPHAVTRDAAQVYRDLAPAVLGYLRGQGAPDPEGLLGEVFLQVARDLHGVRGDDTDVRRWVFAVARHRLIDERRRRAVRPRVVRLQRHVEPPSHDRPEPPFDRELVGALQRLTRSQREVVVLRFVADLSLATVADLTGRRVSAVKALQQRGLARLRRHLDESG